MGSINLLAWAPSPGDKRIQLLLRSFAGRGVRPTIMRCRSTAEKPIALARAIQGLSADAFVVAIDSFDMLCIGDPGLVEDRCRELGKPIVFGAERECFHHLPSSRRVFDERGADAPYRYLNSGLIAGRAGPIREMLSAIESWDLAPASREFQESAHAGEHFNDQTVFGRFAAMNPDVVALDSHATITWSPNGEYRLLEGELAGPGKDIRNPVTATSPCFLHVTQVEKYYPLYLLAALHLGLEISARTIDIPLSARHLNGAFGDPASPLMDERLSRIIRSTGRYRLLAAAERVKAWMRDARMELGRRRRILLGRTGSGR